MRTRSWVLAAIFFAAAGSAVPAVLAQSAPDVDSLRAAATAARQQGDVAQAIPMYTRAVELDPQWAEGWWFLGTMRYGSDLYSPAKEALTHYITLTPTAGPALALRGLCEFELAEYAEALNDIEQGLSLGAANQPRNAKILLYHEAMLLTRLGRFDEAIEKYTVFVGQGETNPDLHLAIGVAGAHLALLPKEIPAGQTEFLSAIGQAAEAVMARNLEQGRTNFQSVFERWPTAPNLHYLYGYLLFPIDPALADDQFRAELAVAPSNAAAHAMLAWSAELRGEFDAALPEARKAAATDGSLPMAQLVLGRALVETGEPAAGVPYLAQVLRDSPDNLEAHISMAKAYSRLGRAEDSRQERMLSLSLADRQVAPRANP